MLALIKEVIFFSSFFAGIVKMIAPIEGPKTVVVMLHLNIYSRSHVLLTHNIAIITVYVSSYTF